MLPLSSCLNDLDQTPSFQDSSESVYGDPVKIKGALARLYATLAVSGQQGPAGLPDIQGIDEGFSNYLRQYWKAQELTTDEAIIAWNDGSLPDYNRLTWNANNEFVRAIYDRIFYQVSLCNEFLRQTTDAKLSDRGISGGELANVKAYRAEARFLRALSYWHAIDMFGNVPFATEESSVGSTAPLQRDRAFMFKYVEDELKAIEGELPEASTNAAMYGRANKAAAWTLLAKLYLNAEVYLGSGQQRNTDAVTYAKKIIDSRAYSLAPDYRLLFLADNDKNAGRTEVIFPVAFDGLRTKTFGGMTFLVHAAVGGSMQPKDFGINGGWFGLRTKKNLVDAYDQDGGTGATDKRALFYTQGQNKEISDIFTFTDGYAVTKYRNVTSTGAAGSDASGDFPDTDFPMFRLADVHLMYAEAALRGGTGATSPSPLEAVNALRTRAGVPVLATLSLDVIQRERARELYWEGHRRTDLIRFGLYTSGTYLWPFKGGARDGRGVDDKYKLFPIPTTDLVANPNLKQNPGY
ncbi:RagB/SusD family nutrient uptake outer membrane protein [Hymenobacter weizhouensis]|uniref:RagB/SusD family nutrient uptake outer membrane protein n=1 Tax=Hymenobacter sp. YIM 151500-1 TaxID=2987689 RepID=UPI0022274A2F|nr:RagB/SusD family nutrient uptake outer membrane protein [Hymenobacter sp. YIM 151500-1]UYZ65197.1 RagB/SusD family nutrient uptake outer membrane protein [Hymenobacter sp. YIM 151500-1]